MNINWMNYLIYVQFTKAKSADPDQMAPLGAI